MNKRKTRVEHRFSGAVRPILPDRLLAAEVMPQLPQALKRSAVGQIVTHA